MSTRDQGGPAFPVHPNMAERLGCINSESDAGMSLRDYFAAAALKGLLSEGNACSKGAVQAVVGWAWAYADAMLEARKE